MPRMSGPATGASKMLSLAMKRTSLPAGCAARPAKVKSSHPVWLMAMTAPPSRGTFSAPVMENCSPRPTKAARAAAITGG